MEKTLNESNKFSLYLKKLTALFITKPLLNYFVYS